MSNSLQPSDQPTPFSLFIHFQFKSENIRQEYTAIDSKVGASNIFESILFFNNHLPASKCCEDKGVTSWHHQQAEMASPNPHPHFLWFFFFKVNWTKLIGFTWACFQYVHATEIVLPQLDSLPLNFNRGKKVLELPETVWANGFSTVVQGWWKKF